MSFVAIAAGVGIAATTYSVVDSVNKNNAAKKIGQNNKRPQYVAPPEIDQVKQLAASEVNNTYLEDYVTRNLDQTFASGTDAILKSGGKLDFSTAYSTYGNQLTSALQQLYKDRDQKLATFNNASYNVAQSKDAEFQYNKDAPFKDAKQQEALLRQQAAQAKAQAFSTASSTISNLGTSMLAPGQYGVNNAAEPDSLLPSQRMAYNPTTLGYGGQPAQGGSVAGQVINPGEAPITDDYFMGGDMDQDGNWVSF